MGQKTVVKNTTFRGVRRILDVLSPLFCRGCGQKGEILCDCCKNYIISNVALEKIYKNRSEGAEAVKIFREARFLGFRDEILGELVEEYKYNAVREIGVGLAEILWKKLEKEVREGERMIVVPMPTSRKHIRERGFDHMDLLIKSLEKYSGGRLKKVRFLERKNDTVQVGAGEELRHEQAKEAFFVSQRYLTEEGRILSELRGVRVILVDDVWTTGASMTEAGRMLKDAGLNNLEAVAITKNRQGRSPLIRERGELFINED